MNNDLISREAAINYIKSVFCKGCNNYDGIRCRACEVDDVLGVIDDVTTVDAVEVVRCKDCAEYIPWLDGERICGRMGSYHGDTKPDDYCSRGRKRE